jgi:hypothetical protein
MEEQQEKEEEDENYSRDTSDETDEEDEDLQPAKQRKPPSLSTNKVLKPREHNRKLGIRWSRRLTSPSSILVEKDDVQSWTEHQLL